MDGPTGRKKKAFGSLFSASVSGQVGEEKLAGRLGRSPPLLPSQKPSPHLSTGESVLVLLLVRDIAGLSLCAVEPWPFGSLLSIGRGRPGILTRKLSKTALTLQATGQLCQISSMQAHKRGWVLVRRLSMSLCRKSILRIGLASGRCRSLPPYLLPSLPPPPPRHHLTA